MLKNSLLFLKKGYFWKKDVMISNEQYKNIMERLGALRRYLWLRFQRNWNSNQEEKTLAPDFWNDAQAAEAHMKQLQNLKKWVTDYQNIRQKAEEI